MLSAADYSQVPSLASRSEGDSPLRTKSFATNCLLFLPAAALLWASSSAAQSREKAAAVTLFDEAHKLVEAGNFADACPKYAESNRLDPQLGALLHLADCYERQGKLASAWSTFREAEEIAEKRADPRQQTAHARAAALNGKVSRLTILIPPTSAVEGMVITRNGVEIGPAQFGTAVPVDAGVHNVRATAPGMRAQLQDISVGERGDQKILRLGVFEPEPQSPPNGSVLAHSMPMDHSVAPTRPSWKTPTLVAAFSLSAVGIGVGVAFQVVRSSKIDERNAICPTSRNCTAQDQRDIDGLTGAARDAGKISVGSFIAGGVMLLGGISLVALTSSSNSPKPTSALFPQLELTGQGLRATYAF